MKAILAYGDSLTYGANPVFGLPRHAYEDRWPSALEAGLNGAARVIAEGLGGRTTVHDDGYADGDRNGARILPTLLASHGPLDMVIIMLGTNDLKPSVGGSALNASYGVRRLVQIVRGHTLAERQDVPKIILVSPPLVIPSMNDEVTLHFGGAIEESRRFADYYRCRATEEGVGFFDAATAAKADPADGVHLDASNTRAIGEGLVPLVRKTLAE